MYGLYIYSVIILIFSMGLVGVFFSKSLFKKVVSMSIMQSSILLFFISLGKVKDARSPIYDCMEFSKCLSLFSGPLPHVLMLTAIVVGIATISVALALLIRIKKQFNTVDENEIEQQRANANNEILVRN